MDTDAVLAHLQQVAAEVILPRWRRLAEHEVAEKNPGDLVTIADHEAEVAITDWLHAAYPGALVVGEEATAADPGVLDALADAEHAFTVDPVDGTRNFVHGAADFGVMLAELRSGQTVRSWIWQPVHARAFVAESGCGAWEVSAGQRRRLHCRPAPADAADWRVATSAFARRGQRPAGLAGLVGSWISCAVDYPKLIDGDADALVYSHTTPWDHAPGTLLVTEAGGRVTRLSGRRYAAHEAIPRGGSAAGPRPSWPQALLISADPAIHDRLRRAVLELDGQPPTAPAVPEPTASA